MKFVWVATTILGLALLLAGPSLADEPAIEEIPAAEPVAADIEPGTADIDQTPAAEPAAAEVAVEITPTDPAPCAGNDEFKCYRRWICPLKEGPDGKLDCAACGTPGSPCAEPCAQPCAQGTTPCDPCRPVCYQWQRVPCYRTVCCPTYETKEVPCYARRRVAQYREVQVPVYETKCVPITRSVCDPRTGVVTTVPCGERYVREQTGTTTRQVCCGYTWERYQSGTRTVRCRTGYEQKQVVCGYRCCRVPVQAAAPQAQPPMPAPAGGPAVQGQEGGCRPGIWVTVTDCPDVSKVQMLPGTVKVVTKVEYEKLRTACLPCQGEAK